MILSPGDGYSDTMGTQETREKGIRYAWDATCCISLLSDSQSVLNFCSVLLVNVYSLAHRFPSR